jgi:uncharacterized protein YggE
MVDAPVVSVRGEASREVPPEVARFAVTVTARDKDRATALSRLAGRVEAVRALVDGYGEAVERRETGALSVRPELKRSGERVAAYHGTATTTVTVVDFAVLAELMLRLADTDQAGVAGPWWELRPASPVHREVRRAAIADALERARDYADALGARLVGLVELADTGVGGNQPVLFRAASYAGSEGAPSLDLDPQVQTARASVEARFRISEPAVVAGPAAG